MADEGKPHRCIRCIIRAIPSSRMIRSRVSPAAEQAKSDRAKPCPVCGKPQIDHFRPFCSRRCADVDLHRWLSGVYAVPAHDDDDGDDAPAGTEERG
jgi:endogenous inhibitor of DNA gyrase (YacG/DUF329 family)